MRRAAALLLLCAACGGSGSSGLAGRYMTVSHTKAIGGCDMPPSDVTGDAYFRIVDTDAINGTFIDYSGCTGADDTACMSGSFPLFDVLTSQGHGVFGSASVSLQEDPSQTAAMCFFDWYGTTVTRTGTTVVIRLETRGGTKAVKQCNVNDGNQLETEGKDLPCEELEILTATLVGK